MQEKLDDIWHQTLKLVKEELKVPTFKTMFESTSPVTIYNGTLIVAAPNAFIKEWLETRHAPMLTRVLSKVMGDNISIKFILKEEEEIEGKIEQVSKEVSSLAKGSISYPPLPSDALSPLNPKYTFDSFVVGNSNRFAHAASLAVAEKPFTSYNPLFIYGGVGLGKTHLLQAIAHYTLKHHKKLKAKYVTSEKFTNDFINAVRDKTIPGFQKKYRENDILLIDDIQFLAGKEQTQEEFFHTFNTLFEAGKQIVISSDRPPKDISPLEDRMRSRFEWGLIVDIQPPDLETRIAILKKKAKTENLSIPNDVLEFIATRIKSNIRELEGALIRVIAFASLHREKITYSLAQEVLKGIFPESESKPISIQLIQNETARYFNIKKADLVGSKRNQSIVYPRQIAMYLTRELTDLSLPKIGEEFGGRDHTTVLHAHAKIERLIKAQEEVFSQIQELTNIIKQKSLNI